jgi:hypothetical protein
MPENLKKLPLNELRQMWSDAWDIPSNTRIGRAMMEKSLQYKIFEKNTQGLSPQEQDKLNQLVKAYKRNPQKSEFLNTNLKDGTRLVRTWKGEKHIVTVSGTKFQYKGLTYGSLSKIANDITGKSWNGWLFFGLKEKSQS